MLTESNEMPASPEELANEAITSVLELSHRILIFSGTDDQTDFHHKPLAIAIAQSSLRK
jgi:hypothetical protein